MKYGRLYKEVLQAIEKQSTCARKQVGAIIVTNGRILSSGWNGSMPGQPHCNDHFTVENIAKLGDSFYDVHGVWSTRSEGHAELSAIATAAKLGIAIGGCEIAVSMSPCNMCAKAIIISGLKKVYFIERYDRDPTGLELLEQCGIECIQL